MSAHAHATAKNPLAIPSPALVAAKAQSVTNSSNAGLLLQRKCACGSSTSSLTGECGDCKSKKLVQTKLTIGASNDPFEQEADRVADQVLAARPNPAVKVASPQIQRFTGQPSASAGTAAPASVDRVLSSPGTPLEPALRQDMEQRFGHDFSRVRVHADAGAEQSARDVDAHAYTLSGDIVFASGLFSPSTHEGRRLLAHELTHVVQQTGGGNFALQRQPATRSASPQRPAVSGQKKPSIVMIVAYRRSTKAAIATLSDGTVEPLFLYANHLDVGEYTLVRYGDGGTYRGAGGRFEWNNPYIPGTKEPRYGWVDTVKVFIQTSPEEQIAALPAHIRDFLTTEGGQKASRQDLLNIAMAGRLLREYGVTENELLLLSQRRIDQRGISSQGEEASDPFTWSLSYVGNRQKSRANEQANVATFLEKAKRLSLASLNIYQVDPLLELIDPDSRISALGTQYALEHGQTIPKGGPSEKIEAPFSDLADMKATLQEFEKTLLSDLRTLSESLLDDTEARLIRMNSEFVSSGEKHWSPAYLERHLAEIKNDPDVIEVELRHAEYVSAVERDEKQDYEQNYLRAKHVRQAVDEYYQRKKAREGKLKEEKERYNEKLRTVVAKGSKVKLSAGSNVGEILAAKSGRAAQLRLMDFIVDGRSKVRSARNNLTDPKFLYAADIVIAKEKELLAKAFGSDCTGFGKGTVQQLVCEQMGSESVSTVNWIIDKLARERRAQTTIWEDLMKVLEVLASAVPGPIGWGIRTVVAVVNFDKKIAAAGKQTAAHQTGMTADAGDTDVFSSAIKALVIDVLPDAPGSFGSKATKRLTLGLDDVSRAGGGEAVAKLGGRELSEGVGREAVSLGPKPVMHPTQIDTSGMTRPVTAAEPSIDMRGIQVGDEARHIGIRSGGVAAPLTTQEVVALRNTERGLLEHRAKLIEEKIQADDIKRSLGDQFDYITDTAKVKTLLPEVEVALKKAEARVENLERQLQQMDDELAHIRTRLPGEAPLVRRPQPPHLGAGKEMEKEVAAAFNLGPKNNWAMVNPDRKKRNFIPDHIAGNPKNPKWGKPYHFKEIKDWRDMSDTGNLSAMLDYVENVGGSQLTIYYKSNTYMSGELRDRIQLLMNSGKVKLVPFVAE